MGRLMHALDRFIFLFGFLAFLSALLTVFSYDTVELKGYEVVVGGEMFNLDPFGLGSVARAYLPFSFIGLAAFLLPLFAGVLVLVRKRFVFLSATLFIISVVMYILLPDATELVYTFGGFERREPVDWTLETGYYLGFMASLIGTLFSVLGILKKR